MRKIKKPYKKCIVEAKRIAKDRDDNQCKRCGKIDGQIHGSHIFGVGAYPKLAVYPLNIKALCSHCHRWWHSTPTESGEWFRSTYPDWWEELEALRKEKEGSLQKINYQKLYYELKEM